MVGGGGGEIAFLTTNYITGDVSGVHCEVLAYHFICRYTANLSKIALTEQSSKMSFGLNLFEDSACISTPLLALILMDLENSFFSSPQATESLQLYLILCLARSLSK